MAKNRVDMITRKEYDRIRKMDHNQMSLFLTDIFQKGYAAGKKEAEGLTETEIRNAVLTVKGIGEKKADDIMQKILDADREKRSRGKMSEEIQ